MLSTQVDSIRRSAVAIVTQLDSPGVENDDEAERRASRLRASLGNNPPNRASNPGLGVNDNTIINHKEGLEYCLKVFNDNKISKDNVWQMSLIDHFRALIDKHHKSLSSFQVVGSSLEASSKIYGIRVDSVHSDVLRMSSGLIRQRIVENPDESMPEISTSERSYQEDEKQPIRKKKRRSRTVTTVTRNKDSINAKLETISETDPIFAKVNSTVEKTNSAKTLLQYVLPSNDSELRFRKNYKIWKSEEAPVNDTDAVDAYAGPFLELPEMNWMPSISDVLRPRISGYVISDIPAENDGNESSSSYTEKTLDQSYIDAQFDINANVEPIEYNQEGFDIAMNENDFNCLDEDDQNAIQACKGLNAPRIVIDDMRPVQATSDLEYSYRTLNDKFNQFWAGPSYWKFKIHREGPVRKLTGEKRKTTSKFEPAALSENTFKEINDGMFISTNNRLAAKLKKFNIYNRWNARASKLPRDYKMDSNRFLEYHSAPGISLSSTLNNAPQILDADSDQSINESNAVYENDMANDDGNNSFENNKSDVIDVAEIATEFVDAPEQINKIDVKFAKTAKVVDMKQLKFSCLNIIIKNCAQSAKDAELPKDNQTLNEEYCDGSSSFYEIYKELPQKLTKNMKEALSPAVAFYSILHLANENNFRLLQDNTKGFQIRQIL